jgi:hypothetical protein
VDRLRTSYSRRRGAYTYDVHTYQITPPASGGRYVARVVNMVRLEAGHPASVNIEFQPEYGATRDEAFSRMEAVVEVWVRNQTQQS